MSAKLAVSVKSDFLKYMALQSLFSSILGYPQVYPQVVTPIGTHLELLRC